MHFLLFHGFSHLHYYFSDNVRHKINSFHDLSNHFTQSRLLGSGKTEKTFITSQGSHIGPRKCRASYQLYYLTIVNCFYICYKSYFYLLFYLRFEKIHFSEEILISLNLKLLILKPKK